MCDVRVRTGARRSEAEAAPALPHRFRLLLDANLALSTERDLDTLLRRFTDIACELTSSRYGALFVEDIGTLVTFVTHGMTQEQADLIGEPPSRTGLHGQLLREGRTVVINNLLDDPRTTGYPPFHPVMRTFLGTPIRVGSRVVGELYLADKNGGVGFDESDVEIVEALAAAAAVAYRNATVVRMEQQSAARAWALLDMHGRGQIDEALFWSQVWAREEERARLAREIHDEQGQLLTSIILFAKHLEQAVNPGTVAQVTELRQLAERALRAARSLAQQLRPMELDEVGLVPAIHRLADHVAQIGGLAVDVVAGAPSVELIYPVEVVIYRIAQEALTNVARHAKAHVASVTVNARDGWLTLVIEDDGIGFDARSVLDSRTDGHLGVRTMRERAGSVGGELVVESRPGAGTLVRLRVPAGERPAALSDQFSAATPP
ncbi:MAG: GAF domain-containing sensor histidine kinase [Jatrophihabitans sp.]|nr:MAG: GAF domain-containing sensor histidine kinase [Jatrophihabitans sp.]